MPYSIYNYYGRSGYLLQPTAGNENEMIVLGHTNYVRSWSDPNLHLHTEAYEYYFLWRGTIHFLVDDMAMTLHGPELLLIKPQVPHAIIGGEGPIEHFGIRAPGLQDKQVVAPLPDKYPAFRFEKSRLLELSWGYRIPLDDGRHQNIWCLGVHKALFNSPPMGLAYLNFPSQRAAQIDKTRPQLHRHQDSWEYYTVLNGCKVIRIDHETITLKPGDICVIPPGTPHAVLNRIAPYQGFTIRAPLKADKIENKPLNVASGLFN